MIVARERSDEGAMPCSDVGSFHFIMTDLDSPDAFLFHL
jgi:hypothetical protein